MTADAKVGLLLGLVFIVIIAFLVNGLPQVLEGSDIDSLRTPMPIEQPTEILHTDAKQAVQNVIQDRSVDRRKVDLPDKEVVIIESQNPQNKELAAAPSLSEQNKPQAPLPGGQTKQRTYIVQPGDSLGKIAKTVFGEILGNKAEVVDKIFAANPQLPNKHEIRVGQELTIPDLFVEKKEKSASSLPNPEPGFFSKVERVLGLGADKSAEKQSPSPPQPAYATYSVRSDDTLWDIAQEKLGNGNRYKEILDLNKNKIKDPHSIPAGLVLKIPNS
ncbi:MAG: LysM peptidoglycan-binding domain-containing protein [Sedimentisphaerales bacterium]|nr:LysM peptidoglycan-binding domain-containing protein [Sedimentisphaerales bacterium]